MEEEEVIVIWILLLGLGLFLSLIYDITVLEGVMGERTPVMNYYFVEFAFLFTVPVIILLVTLFLVKDRKLIIPWWILIAQVYP
jgi:hypothetical protein